jgi:hypothetical protein
VLPAANRRVHLNRQRVAPNPKKHSETLKKKPENNPEENLYKILQELRKTLNPQKFQGKPL